MDILSRKGREKPKKREHAGALESALFSSRCRLVERSTRVGKTEVFSLTFRSLTHTYLCTDKEEEEEERCFPPPIPPPLALLDVLSYAPAQGKRIPRETERMRRSKPSKTNPSK